MSVSDKNINTLLKMLDSIIVQIQVLIENDKTLRTQRMLEGLLDLIGSYLEDELKKRKQPEEPQHEERSLIPLY